MSVQRLDIHQHITNQIIAAIEKGAGTFHLPWHRAAGSITRPVNIASKKPYQGINILTLWAAGDEAGYQSGIWGTYRQWAEAKAQVRPGEKASHIVFYKEISVTPDDADPDDSGSRLVARATPVFAAEQVDGYAPPQPEPKTPSEIADEIITAERFIAASGALVLHAGDRAYYRPSTDTIHLPPREAFRSTATSTAREAYYATKLHELVHWTGIASRCNREFGKRFGDNGVRVAAEQKTSVSAASCLGWV